MRQSGMHWRIHKLSRLFAANETRQARKATAPGRRTIHAGGEQHGHRVGDDRAKTAGVEAGGKKRPLRVIAAMRQTGRAVWGTSHWPAEYPG